MLEKETVETLIKTKPPFSKQSKYLCVLYFSVDNSYIITTFWTKYYRNTVN